MFNMRERVNVTWHDSAGEENASCQRNCSGQDGSCITARTKEIVALRNESRQSEIAQKHSTIVVDQEITNGNVTVYGLHIEILQLSVVRFLSEGTTLLAQLQCHKSAALCRCKRSSHPAHAIKFASRDVRVDLFFDRATMSRETVHFWFWSV